MRWDVSGSGVKSDFYVRKITLRGVEDRLERLSLQPKRSVRKVGNTRVRGLRVCTS